MFWFCVWCTQCWVATSGLSGFWCGFVYWVRFEEHKPWIYGYYDSGAFLLIYMLYLFTLCMATWQVSIWLSVCISHLLWNTNSLSAGYLILLIVCAYLALGPCFHNSQREMKYRNSGAGCSRNVKLCLYTGLLVRKGQVVWPPSTAECEGWQTEYFKWKMFKFFTQQIFNYWAK